MTDYLHEAQELEEYTRFLRRDFHRHPEIGFQEVRTAGIVARELTSMGIEVRTGIGKTGVVGLIEGRPEGPVLLMRFDMDALPIQEQTNAEYASQTPGVMHACGHDAHTAVGLTVARLLNEHRSELAGTVKLVFQPAEEGLGGADAMLADGVLENPAPNMALAFHVWNDKPTGWIGLADGPVMAAAEKFMVRLEGKGGHGASPNQAIDPVVAAAQIVSALQTIVSRNVDPLDTAVVSVTAVLAGEAFNVIPGEAELRGTIRTFQPETRKKVLERFHQIVSGTAEAMGCRAEVEITPISEAVVNNPQVAARVRQVVHDLFPGAELETVYRTMGSEDMASILKQVPGCYIFMGSSDADRGLNAPHHHPCFDIDEHLLPTAAGIMAESALRLLSDGALRS